MRRPRPHESQDGINIISYADDFTLLTTGPDIYKLCGDLNLMASLDMLSNWFEGKSLKLAMEKFAAIRTETVSHATSSYKRNVVLDAIAPSVSADEIRPLPEALATLAQLRSGKFHLLNSFANSR